ncbi:Fungal-trans domain-containing protein [Fusarium sp. Ph1]|nr:Fungal-trans domain-containing protein [Fusarium sp. Ph1]
MANGPGFNVGSPEPDSRRPEEEAVDAMARHPSSPSAHSAIFGTSNLSSSDKLPGDQDPRSPANILPPTSLSATAEAPPLGGQHAQIVTRGGRLQVAEDGHSSPSLKNLPVDGELAIKSAGLQWEGDPAYEAHLWECYLTWLNPLTSLVERNLFDQDKENFLSSQDSNFYSPALENAIFSIGAIHTMRQHPSIMGNACKLFASRAKVYLDLELQTPTIATLQALVLLCEHEAAQGRDSQGWIYSGIASRILSDLGLHSQWSSPDETESRGADISDIKARVFWSVVHLDTSWSSWCGRPQSLATRDLFFRQAPTMRRSGATDTDSQGDVHIYLAPLVTHFSKVIEYMYHDKDASRDSLSKSAAQIDASLRDWTMSLPPFLQLRTTQDDQCSDPVVLQLHLLYHEIRILLHRPLIGSSYPATNLQSPSGSGTESHHDICTNSASDIIHLMGQFRDRFGLSHLSAYCVHILTTAGILLAYNTSLTNQTREFRNKSASLTQASIRMMTELTSTFPSAHRSLEVLTSLRREWQNCNEVGTWPGKMMPETG